MELIEDSNNRPFEAHPSDFRFIHTLIEELNQIPTKDKVVFPLPNRTSTFADIECTVGYNHDEKPYGEFYFVLRKHELEMAHTAVVTTVVVNDTLRLHVQIKPNRKLQQAGHRSVTRTAATAKEMAILICQNYGPGSIGRKVVPLTPVKPKDKKTA